MSALGLTDHRLLSGSIEFVLACRKVEVQPILGLEIDSPWGTLSLLATSTEGWANLCRLSSFLALQPDPGTACSFETLALHSWDLIALCDIDDRTSGDPLAELKNLFPDRLYVALRQPSSAPWVSGVASRLHLPTVVAPPIYYLSPDQASLQHTLAAIRLNRPIEATPPQELAPGGAYFASPAEIATRFKPFPAALEATGEIAARCRFELPLGIARMPTVPLPPGMTASLVLREKAEAGVRRLYGEITPQIHARLEHELDVIARMGFEPIFLIVEDILNYARKTGVPFSSRGSAASSLVAHCLGITSPDPLRLELYFERFLNPARTTPPDIDTDLCSRRRDGVIQHVFDTYSADRVAMVGTINRFRPRSALGDVAKAHGLNPERIRELANQLPYSYFARLQEGEEGTEPVSPFADLRKLNPGSIYQRIFDEAEALLKLPRHLSVHAGGLIVAPGPLTDLVPVMRSGSKGITITQLDLEAVEALGLVKIDLLGIRGLTVLGDVADFIRTRRDSEPLGILEVLDSIPTEDPLTAQRVETGQTIGCFQIESPGMRSTLREIRARSSDDIMAALALYRPGPLSGGLKDAFVRRFKGEEVVSHLHPALEPLLRDTFGVILYQEQVLRIAHELAGFSLAEADLLRRAMSHFDPGNKMQELRQKFIQEAQARSGVPGEVGERVWEMMAAFAGYGFPKAHAASYAQVAWRSAWCKTYFPAEFMAAVLANGGGYYSQRVYINEARRLGLHVRPPHVNYSRRDFIAVRSKDQDASLQATLFMGLDQVKELTQKTIERILRGRPFKHLEEFLERVDPRLQEAENLARVGALDGLGKIPSILRRLKSQRWQAGQRSLFALDEDEPEGEDWSLEEKVGAQQELLGVSLEADPLEFVADRIAAAGAITTLEAAERIGQHVIVAGLRQSSHRSRTSKGEIMMFLTLEDLAGMLDLVLFPDAYRRSQAAISSNAPLLVVGKMEMDTSRGEPLMRVERITRIN
jgi:DNA-directed DNA polymerase III PolC